MSSTFEMNDTHNPSDQLLPFIRMRSESGSESMHYSLFYEGLPDEFRMMVEKKLHETEEKRNTGIKRLKDLTKKEHLDILDDHLLLAVLRSCKFNLKKSEGKLRNFLAHRRVIIQKVAKLDLAVVERALIDMGAGILPYRDRHGCLILFTRPYGMNLEKYTLEDGATMILASFLFALTFELTTVTGVVYFGECKSPSIYKLMTVCNMIRQALPTLFSFPLRFAKCEILNEIAVIRWFLNIISPIIPEKIRKRITMNGSGYDNLHKSYPPDILPEEFGGNMGPMNVDIYKDKYLDFIRKLKSEAKLLDSTKH